MKIVIIGGGPSGSVLAHALSAVHDVQIIEKRRIEYNACEPGERKCCGGLLAPDAQKVLASMGIGIPEQVLTGPQVFSVRSIDSPSGLERFYQRHYINIDRERFDRFLLKTLPSRITVTDNAFFRKLDGTLQKPAVRYSRNGREHTISADLVIGADGANSRIRKCLLPAEKRKIYFSIQEIYEMHTPMPHFTVFFDRLVTDYYSWIIPKDNTILLGSALVFDGTMKEKFEYLRTIVQAAGYPLAQERKIRTASAWIERPGWNSPVFAGRQNVLLLGEAAGFISPSSAEGFSFAFKSALELADAINTHPNHVYNDYKRRTACLRRLIAAKRIKSIAMYNPHLRRMILRSGINSIKMRNWEGKKNGT
ncbi:MAG: FAD-binding protein [Spirochaetales bacterium]|nr:FAD-binding protein [Spirochaetales bacterium]